jgi:hypothetical protein
MIELADQRRIADLENPQPRLEVMQTLRDEMHPRLGETLLPREERRPLQEYRQPQHDDRIPVHNDSRPQHDNVHPLNDERRSFHQNRHPTQSGGQAWRGDEYMPPEHQQEREGQRLLQEDRTPQPEVRRTRRVSFADEREYFEVGSHRPQHDVQWSLTFAGPTPLSMRRACSDPPEPMFDS